MNLGKNQFESDKNRHDDDKNGPLQTKKNYKDHSICCMASIFPHKNVIPDANRTIISSSDGIANGHFHLMTPNKFSSCPYYYDISFSSTQPRTPPPPIPSFPWPKIVYVNILIERHLIDVTSCMKLIFTKSFAYVLVGMTKIICQIENASISIFGVIIRMRKRFKCNREENFTGRPIWYRCIYSNTFPNNAFHDATQTDYNKNKET